MAVKVSLPPLLAIAALCVLLAGCDGGTRYCGPRPSSAGDDDRPVVKTNLEEVKQANERAGWHAQ